MTRDERINRHLGLFRQACGQLALAEFRYGGESQRHWERERDAAEAALRAAIAEPAPVTITDAMVEAGSEAMWSRFRPTPYAPTLRDAEPKCQAGIRLDVHAILTAALGTGADDAS